MINIYLCFVFLYEIADAEECASTILQVTACIFVWEFHEHDRSRVSIINTLMNHIYTDDTCIQYYTYTYKCKCVYYVWQKRLKSHWNMHQDIPQANNPAETSSKCHTHDHEEKALWHFSPLSLFFCFSSGPIPGGDIDWWQDPHQGALCRVMKA